MAEIFVSYRRDLSQWSAGRMNDRLEVAFGAGRVFFDTVTIKPGDDFVEVLGTKVGGCRVLIAVIAPGWVEQIEARRDESNDFVRIEIAEALRRKVRVVPVLIDGAKPPAEGRLPDDLKALSRLHAVPVRADTFGQDMAALTAFLKEFLDGGAGDAAAKAAPSVAGATTTPPIPPRPRRVVPSVPASKPERLPRMPPISTSSEPSTPAPQPPILRRLKPSLPASKPERLPRVPPISTSSELSTPAPQPPTLRRLKPSLPTVKPTALPPNQLADEAIERALKWLSGKSPRVPTADEAIAAAGKWIEAYGADRQAKTPPPIFGGLFIVVRDYGDTFNQSLVSLGAIVSGSRWDGGTSMAKWKLVHGWHRMDPLLGDVAWHDDKLTYLGPEWRPEFKALSDAVFKKLGGTPLKRRIEHP